MNEHLTESEEEDIGKCQGYTYTDVPSYTSPAFL